MKTVCLKSDLNSSRVAAVRLCRAILGEKVKLVRIQEERVNDKRLPLELVVVVFLVNGVKCVTYR